MRNELLKSLALAGLVSGLAGCETPLEGLLPAPKSEGPKVVFDLLARPLPEIPFPNDLATRYDPDSPTGRRVNASLVAPTLLEKHVREEFSLLDGWGTLSPITVSFTQPIDPNAVREAHLDDDPSNDAVYIVHLKTGEIVPLDLGRGNYPVLVQNNDKYFENDHREQSSNVLFETYAEDCETPGGPVSVENDTDADELCDIPNTRDPSKPRKGVNPDDRAANANERGNDIYRDLLEYYERESNTLIIRPVVSLAQRSEYAVILTDRIKDESGRSIASPFAFVNHASQNDQLRPLLSHLGKGKLSSVKPENVVFTWAFTTQSVTTDLEAIREGLYGRGTLGWIGNEVSDRLEPVRTYDQIADELIEHPVHPANTLGQGASAYAGNPYVVPMKDFIPKFAMLGDAMGINEGPDLDQVVESYKFVDYFVVGSFRTANFLDDPSKPTFDAVFRVNPKEGKARVWKRPADWTSVEEEAIVASVMRPTSPQTDLLRQAAKRALRDRVWFMLAVPKAHGEHQAPFPVSIYGHGYTSSRVEMLGFAGNLAKFGIASVSIDSYGHGLDVSQTDRIAIQQIIGQGGFAPLMDALFKGRGRDLDNDLIDNSGGDFWTADTFHTRDVVRQSVVDWMQLIRVFHAFGTYEMGDLDGDGKPEIAGDFNADGVPDVGGPEYPNAGWWTKAGGEAGKRNPGHDFFVWGQSLGGILGGILPAVEPTVAAAAPVAGGAGLSDIGIRSEQGGVIQAVFMEILGPILFTRPAPEGGAHLYWQIQDVNDDRIIQLTESPIDLKPGDVLRAWNEHTDDGEPRKEDFALVKEDLRVRLQIAADNASFYDDAPLFKMNGYALVLDENNIPVPIEPIRVGRCESAEVLEAEKKRTGLIHPADCLVITVERAGEEVQRIDRFPRDITFQQRRFAKDTPLVALARGFAMKRGTKTFRRFMSLAQTILEPGDPGGYSRQYFLEPLESRKDDPPAVLVVGTTGDLNVPVNTAITQGRIAGLVPHEYDASKHSAWGMSPNDVLIRSKATEAIEKLKYYLPAHEYMNTAEAEREAMRASLSAEDKAIVDLVDCSQGTCATSTLVDVTHYAFDGTRFLDRENRVVRVRDGGAPRLKDSLQPAMIAEHKGKDAAGQPITRKSAMIMPYLESTGKHGFDVPHPTDPFDIDLFMINMFGRYFQTRGQDLSFKTCMHRDGFDRSRFDVREKIEVEGTLVSNPNYRQPDPEAQRVAGCEFIPDYPASF